MRELPAATDLLAGVAEFLRNDAMPALTGKLAFHARVAANVVDIVRRELERADAAETEETARLRSLLAAEGDLDALNARLCDGIAGGTLDGATPGLAEHLWATTLDALAINQPQYGRYRRESARGQADKNTA